MREINQKFDGVEDPMRSNATRPLRNAGNRIAVRRARRRGMRLDGAFGRSKLEFPRRFMTLEHGVPSHDAFSGLFNALGPGGLHDALWKLASGWGAPHPLEQAANFLPDAPVVPSAHQLVDVAAQAPPLVEDLDGVALAVHGRHRPDAVERHRELGAVAEAAHPAAGYSFPPPARPRPPCGPKGRRTRSSARRAEFRRRRRRRSNAFAAPACPMISCSSRSRLGPAAGPRREVGVAAVLPGEPRLPGSMSLVRPRIRSAGTNLPVFKFLACKPFWLLFLEIYRPRRGEPSPLVNRP